MGVNPNIAAPHAFGVTNSLAQKYAESAEPMGNLQSEVVSMITAAPHPGGLRASARGRESPDHIRIQVVA